MASLSRRFLVSTAVLFVLVALLIQTFSTRREEEEEKEKRRVDTASIASNRIPVLLRGVDLSLDWRRQIDPARVMTRFLSHVRLQPTPIFVLRANEAQEGSDPPLSTRLPGGLVTEQRVRISAFFQAVVQDYVYATLNLEEWPDEEVNFHALEKSWRSTLAFDDPGVDSALSTNSSLKALSTAMLWFSQRGVVAHTHYDVSHNFLTQLRGTKIIEIWLPDDHEGLHFFPHIHRARQQSQEIYTALNKEPSFVFELTPGDVLYIPPYYSHRVHTTSSASLSLSVISPSSEDFAAQRAFAVGAPLTKCQNSSTTRAVAVQVFLVHLLSRLPSFTSPAEAAGRLLRSRYLYATNDKAQEKDICVANDHHLHRTARACLDPQAVIDHVDAIAKHLITALPSSITDIVILDYVESLVAWAVGPKEVASYLRTCLDFQKLDTSVFERRPITTPPGEPIFSI